MAEIRYRGAPQPQTARQHGPSGKSELPNLGILDELANAANYVDHNFAQILIRGYAKSHGVSENQALNILILLGNTAAVKIDSNNASRARDKAAVDQALGQLGSAARVATRVANAGGQAVSAATSNPIWTLAGLMSKL